MKTAGGSSQRNPAIAAKGLTKWFGEGATKTTAVDQVGLEAYFGEMLFIVGPSGSGKTTMLSMLSGILRPNAGSVAVKVPLTEEEVSLRRPANVTGIPNRPALPSAVTVQSAAVLQLPPAGLFHEIVHAGSCAAARVADRPMAKPPPPPTMSTTDRPTRRIKCLMRFPSLRQSSPWRRKRD